MTARASDKLLSAALLAFGLAATLCAAPAAAQEAEAVDSDQAVSNGRDALDEWGRYPWYDSGEDDVRLIDLDLDSDPAPSPTWTGGGPNWNFDFLQVFGWLGIAALLFIIAWLLVKFFLNRETDSASKADSQQMVQADHLTDVEALPPQARDRKLSLLEEARRAYEQGNYSEAIIYLFSHQLVSLDRRQFIRLAKGKTNRQYLRELKKRGTLGGLFEQTMVCFEDVFFGKHDLDRQRFESCWSRLPEFDAVVTQGTA